MPVNIRKAVVADIPELLRLGRAFHAANGIAKTTKFDEETATFTLNNLIAAQANNDAILLVSDHLPTLIAPGGPDSHLGGMLAMLAFPGYFDRHTKMVQEIFWWAEDKRGLSLIREAKEWAKTLSPNPVPMMVAETGRGDERMQRVYKRLGFEPVERFYLGIA